MAQIVLLPFPGEQLAHKIKSRTNARRAHETIISDTVLPECKTLWQGISRSQHRIYKNRHHLFTNIRMMDRRPEIVSLAGIVPQVIELACIEASIVGELMPVVAYARTDRRNIVERLSI